MRVFAVEKGHEFGEVSHGVVVLSVFDEVHVAVPCIQGGQIGQVHVVRPVSPSCDDGHEAHARGGGNPALAPRRARRRGYLSVIPCCFNACHGSSQGVQHRKVASGRSVTQAPEHSGASVVGRVLQARCVGWERRRAPPGSWWCGGFLRVLLFDSMWSGQVFRSYVREAS